MKKGPGLCVLLAAWSLLRGTDSSLLSGPRKLSSLIAGTVCKLPVTKFVGVAWTRALMLVSHYTALLAARKARDHLSINLCHSLKQLHHRYS